MAIIILSIAAVLIIVIVINTIRAGSVDSSICYSPEAADPEALKRLAGAIRIPTVSHYDISEDDKESFKALQNYLVESFPKVHEVMERTVLSEYSVIYKWKGRHDEFSSEHPPVLLTAHYDVVPADESKWSFPPFGGIEKEGFLWGRGTLDTKNTLMSLLEAAETLCSEGFIPERTVYLAFGGDEETTGCEGASRSCRWFSEHGITFDWLWDEGAITVDGMMPGINNLLSLIGTTEKGQVSIELHAKASGAGHAAMPPKISAAGRIARAVARIEAKPFPMRWLKTTRAFFSKMARAGGFGFKLALSNLWLTGGLIKFVMSKIPSVAAMFRTTTAPTMLNASSKENVLADEATAVINVRLLPGDSIEKVISRMKKVIADDQVSVYVKNDNDAEEAAPESSSDAEGYKLLEQTLNELIPDSVVLPYLATTASDTRNYVSCCRNMYRYSPMILTQQEVNRIHGVDERISLENYGLAIKFYKTMLKKL